MVMIVASFTRELIISFGGSSIQPEHTELLSKLAMSWATQFASLGT